jgi:acyl-coenzyme A synthetase/AMP-(fatty) acid ligase
VPHTLASLAGAITRSESQRPVIWGTFYDIRRYGGLQIYLRAVLTRSSLVITGPQEPLASFLQRAGEAGVTHISGTPSHWRRALMSPAADEIAPRYIRLSGEISDQAILNSLRSFYQQAEISHAFATTEAGVAFDVRDGLSGFPVSVLSGTPGVELKVVDSTLRVRSSRTSLRYLGENPPVLRDPDGFVDTGDALVLRDGRYYFQGRRDGVINVGGLKVHPEEVEAVLNSHPEVRLSLVKTKKSPITGALVVADVQLRAQTTPEGDQARELQLAIKQFCRDSLPPHKVPAAISFVPAIDISETGKLVRRHA